MRLHTVDSLEAGLQEIPADAEHAVERADLLTQLAMEVREFEQWDRMLNLSDEARELSVRAGYPRGVARSMVVRAFVEYIHSDYGAAITDCTEALKTAGEDEETVAEARAILALVHWSLGNF